VENPFPSTLRELVNDAIAFGLDGKQVDALVATSGINFLNPEKPVPALLVEVSGAPVLERFVKDRKIGALLFDHTTLFVSIFPRSQSGFPLARVYRLSVPDLLEFARIGRSFEERGIRVVPMLPEEFKAAIEFEGYEQRIKDYCAAYQKRTGPFSELVAGRRSSTSVEHGFCFYSKGCLVCGREDVGLLTTTLGGVQGESGFMVGFYVCPEHLAEADKDVSYYHYLKRRCGLQPGMIAGEASREFFLEATANFLRSQLHCQVRINGVTLTAERPSGFRIIVRLGDDRKYAYVFLNAKGTEVARIDASDHHDVPFGPAHLHRAPEKNKKDVVPSFTTGTPMIDGPIIRRIVEEHDG
jgi:hypothetical protein